MPENVDLAAAFIADSRADEVQLKYAAVLLRDALLATDARGALRRRIYKALRWIETPWHERDTSKAAAIAAALMDAC